MPSGNRPGHARGFAYIFLLVMVALLGGAAAATLELGATMARRDAERQLLAVGGEIQAALRSYAGVAQHTATGVQAQGPQTLDDLLRDPRAPGVRRHLRQLYADPMTGKPDWTVLRDAQGRITGVHSQAAGTPIKRTGFDAVWASFEDADSYQKWVFGLPAVMPATVPGSRPRGTTTTP